MSRWTLILMGLFTVATVGSSAGDMPAYHTVSADAYGHVNSDAINDITVARNGDVIVTGYYDDSDDGDRDVVLARYDPQGRLLWRQVFGTTADDDEGHSVIETHDGDIVIVGYRTTAGEGADFLISRWSATGDQRRYTCYWGRQTGHDEKLYAVIESSDHGLWATGHVKSFFPEGRAKVVLVNISPDGSELACARAGKVADNWDVYGRDLCEVFGTDGFCVTGNVIDHDLLHDDQRVLLAKFDDTTGYLWARRFGDLDYDRTLSTHAIIRTSDRCLALAGDEAFWNGIYMDYGGYVLKTDLDAHLAWGSKASGSRTTRPSASAISPKPRIGASWPLGAAMTSLSIPRYGSP